jgi:hypothetical protein
MTLGRKIDNKAWRGLPRFENEHAPRLHVPTLASNLIGFEVFGEDIFELQSDAASHYTNAIDCVNKRIRVALKNVSRGKFDHHYDL